MERTETGVVLDLVEVLACGLSVADIPHHIPHTEIPELAEDILMTINMRKSARDFILASADHDGDAVMAKHLQKSQDKIIDVGVVYEGLVAILADQVTESFESGLADS